MGRLLGDEKMGDKTQKEVINQEATQKVCLHLGMWISLL